MTYGKKSFSLLFIYLWLQGRWRLPFLPEVFHREQILDVLSEEFGQQFPSIEIDFAGPKTGGFTFERLLRIGALSC